MYIINKEFVISVFMLINIMFTPCQLSASCIVNSFIYKGYSVTFYIIHKHNRLHHVPKRSKARGQRQTIFP